MYLAKKKHKPRYQMLVKIKKLSSQLQQIASLAKNLKSDKVMLLSSHDTFNSEIDLISQDSVEKAARKIQENINDVIRKIKTNESLRTKDMDKLYKGLVDQINAELSNVKSKVIQLKVLKSFIFSLFLSLHRLRSRKLQKSKKN